MPQQRPGIGKIMSRQFGIKTLKNSEVQLLTDGEFGMHYFAGDNCYIVLDERTTLEERRLTACHEMAHILLGHDLPECNIPRHLQEFEAESLARLYVSLLYYPTTYMMGKGVSV